MGRLQRRAALIGGLAAALACGGAAVAAKAPYRGTAEDFAGISQLFARYDFAIDNKDGEAWADTFTPDGVFRDPSWCAVGREQLIGVVGRKPRIGADQEQFHMPSLGPITYQGRDHATVHSTVMVIRRKGAGYPDGGIGVTGTYDDTLVRRNGRWLFAYRLVHRPSATPPVACSATPPFEAGATR